MNKRYADIIVDISQEKLDKSFQYEIPEELIFCSGSRKKRCGFPLEREDASLLAMW